MFLVYGLQKSGISVTNLLQNMDQKHKIWDDSAKVRKELKKKFNKKLFFNPKYENLEIFDKIFVSPGISLRQKKFQVIKKSKLKRDLDLYISKTNNQNIIAVTGTNGKSTTTKLIGDVLKKNKINAFVGGNIGEPLCNSLLSKKQYDYHVIELSSFQLETINKINTKISIITNLSNDHLDRYENINDYIKQKKNIISKNGINIFSIDDKFSKKLYLQKNIKNKICFSISNQSADIYMNNGHIYDKFFSKNQKIIIKNISKDLEGHFNNQNILIAYICSKLLKLSKENFLKTINSFIGLPYRSKIILDNKRFKIINNSKSTNINSTINSIENYYEIYLILGGIAKEKNFEIISNYIDRINCIYVYGKSASFIEKKLNKFLNVKKFKNLKSVIDQIFKDTKNNKFKSNILFAPACSSYDQYKNFEDRGKMFTKLIKNNLKKL